SLVEQDGELLFTQQPGEPARCRDVARRQRGQGRGVDVVGGAAAGDELSVLVDEEDGFGIGIPREAIADGGDAAVVLLVDDKLLDHSSRPLARRLAEPSLRIRTHSLAERGAKKQKNKTFTLTRSEEHTSELQSRENLVC